MERIHFEEERIHNFPLDYLIINNILGDDV